MNLFVVNLLGESSNKSLVELSVPVGDRCIDDGLIFIECDCDCCKLVINWST